MYFDSTTESSLEIIDGDSFGIMVSFNKNSNVESMDYSLSIYNDQSFFREMIFGSTESNHIYFNDIYNSDFYSGPGIYTIEGIVVGSDGDMETKTLNLIVLENIPENSAPVITSTPISEIEENEDYEYLVIAEDAEDDDLTYELVQNPSWLTLEDNRIYGTAPEITEDYQYVVTVKVSDGIEFTTQNFTIDVIDTTIIPENSAPIIFSTPLTQVNENKNYIYQINAMDFDSITLQYSLIDSPSWLTIEENIVSGTAPEVNENTEFYVKIKVTDGVNDVYQDYILTVINSFEENTAPVSNNVKFTTFENTPVEIVLNSDDAENDDLIYTITLENGYSINVTNEVITYQPLEDFIGVTTLTYVAFDGEFYSNVATITIDVIEILDFDAPEITIIYPEDKEYDDDDLLFEILVNEDAESWFVIDGENYVMDKYGNTHNLTINNLDDGTYTVTFYARDLAGNVASKALTFSIDTTNGGGSRRTNILNNSYVPEGLTHPVIGLGAIILLDEEIDGSELNWCLIVISLLLLILLISILLIKRLKADSFGEQEVYTPNEKLY
jgi:hypothetical protein